MVDRIGVTQQSPATSFWLEADHIQTDAVNGRWRVRFHLRAANGPGGSTGSMYGGSGVQIGRYNGIEFGRHSGNPFLPSGYANGAQRWRDGPWDVWVNGRAAWNMPVTMTLQYGSINVTYSGHIPLPANPVPTTVPAAPTPLAVDQITPTSARYRFSGNSNGGSAILEWQAQIATNATFTSGVRNDSHPTSGTRTFASLIPGTNYYFRARGRNAVGWGPWSSVISARTLAGGRRKVGGTWVASVRWLRVAGSWRRTRRWRKVAGTWRLTR